ncbi:MAG TPA: hypothetical protein VMT15_09090 [Bryobacteraceae bacterium]|nr:hypothetical protein [Bryobacteraceae bacterium]
MTVHEYLKENGYPEHVVREGREGLVRKYREFVKQVEHGYGLGLEDYRNDLDARAILALAEAEDDEVHQLDARLKKLLTGCDKRVWESAPGDPFWDFGYPRNAGPDLMKDLRSQDLTN